MLVLAPTRELAQQVANEASILGQAFGVRNAAVYGGVKYGPQLERCAGRTHGHQHAGTHSRPSAAAQSALEDDLRMLVFDEADHMLSMGFYPDMLEIQRYLPRARCRPRCSRPLSPRRSSTCLGSSSPSRSSSA
ncbi:MAG: DEAD/DEAH box helicase [Caldilineaceae bacterium]